LKVNDFESLKRKAIVHSSLVGGEDYMDSFGIAVTSKNSFIAFSNRNQRKLQKLTAFACTLIFLSPVEYIKSKRSTLPAVTFYAIEV